jgi:serine phosphatase RsbU (regulator of sigma subunit)
VTIASASLLSDLELQREQALAEARAIQIGMLPQAALRTADRAICYSFHPFHEVGGDFLDFFTLPDGAIGLSGRRHGETCGGIIRSAGCGDLARGSQYRRATAFSIEPA